MQMRSRTMIVGGATVALIGALVVFVYARNVTGHVAGEPAATAYVAKNDIPAGMKAEAAVKSMEARPVPTGLRPADAITAPAQLAGRTAVRSIGKGEVITLGEFGTGVSAPGAGLQIPPGKNAVSISMSLPQGVANFVQVGDFVDIYANVNNQGKTTTKLLLQHVQVLANRAAYAQQNTSSSTSDVLLTLALTPDDAERLIFVKQNASLWLGLMRATDKPVVTTGRTNVNVLP